MKGGDGFYVEGEEQSCVEGEEETAVEDNPKNDLGWARRASCL